MNALEQRIFGLLHIARGVTMLLMGNRAPNWVLMYARAKAKHNER